MNQYIAPPRAFAPMPAAKSSASSSHLKRNRSMVSFVISLVFHFHLPSEDVEECFRFPLPGNIFLDSWNAESTEFRHMCQGMCVFELPDPENSIESCVSDSRFTLTGHGYGIFPACLPMYAHILRAFSSGRPFTSMKCFTQPSKPPLNVPSGFR